MSYDIYLRSPKPSCHECGRPFPDPDIQWAPTGNLTPIFVRALPGDGGARGLYLLSGCKAADTVTWLQKADEHLNDPKQRAALEALQPANGWGDLKGAIEVIQGLLELAREYPEYVWEIH